MARWIEFVPLGESDSGLTKRWAVRVKPLRATQVGAALGTVQWYARWRKYAFFPFRDTLYEQDCLCDVAAFLEEQTAAQRARPRAPLG